MKFKFHLYVQRHRNHTYTVTVLPFHDLTSYGINLAEIKAELGEAVKERVLDMPPHRLHTLEFDTRIYLQKVSVELRPTDRKKRNRRREKVRLLFSLLVHPQEDGQLFVTVPKLAPNGPSFYVYNASELQEQATIELVSWLDNHSLDQLMSFQYARSETLETLELDIPLKKKAKDSHSTGLDRPDALDLKEDKFWALREMGVNLTAQIAEQRYRRAYRRDEIINQVMQILMHARNNSVLLTGNSESGKTAIVQELVRRIARKDAPEALHGREVWMLAPDRIIAGAQYIGTWEERISDLVNECRKKQHILYITDVAGLLEAGRWSKSDSNVGQALRPYISSGEVIILGETSPSRLEMGERLGPAFMSQFRRIEVPAMSEEETMAVLGNVSRDLDREYEVRIDPSAIEAATQLSRRFLPYRAFPGKAIRLLEESAGDVAQARKVSRFEDSDFRSSLLRRRRASLRVSRDHVLSSFSRHSGMPEFIINDRVRLDLSDVEQYLRERVAGQDHAVSAMVSMIATVKAGLNDPNKPLGVFLFIGPTGVGKTHMGKTLASYLFGSEERLIRFDMSEYGDIDGVARLIGAFNSEGELTKQVRAQPFSVVLLDEFEKASSRIYDVFLQVLGEGRLTDAGGRTTYFHNTIIILTSNLGSDVGSIGGFGFGRDSLSHAEINAMLVDHYRDKIERYFRPEFVNRLDQIVVFGQLDETALRLIAARELRQVLDRDGITRRNLLVEIEDDVIDLVLERGYSPQYGARPLKREIERVVVMPMARQLAQRSADDRQLLRVGVDWETRQISLKTVPIEEAGTTVTLMSGLDQREGQTVQIDMAEVVEQFAMLRRKLSDWLDSDTINQMMAQKAALLSATQSSEFWSHGEAAQRKLSRFYFLDRITSRLRQLYERCEYLEDFAVLVNRERDTRYQSELLRDLQELQRDVVYLEVEMQTGHLPHRHHAMMLINPLGEAAWAWACDLAKMYLEWAEYKGYVRDVYVLERNRFERVKSSNFREMIQYLERVTGTDELALSFEGSNVFGFLKGERGIHQRREREALHEELARVRVFAIPDGTNVARWLQDYQRIKQEIRKGERPAPPDEKYSIVRLYALGKAGERFVRDTRTGTHTTRVKEVMEKGYLDEFILALLRQSGGGANWEDRFPPTFPY